MLVVVDSAQRLHFQQVFEVADRLQLTKAQNLHVAFGRMRFRDASMSTRKGNILLLSDLLSEAKKRVARKRKEQPNRVYQSRPDSNWCHQVRNPTTKPSKRYGF
jgi:arginyl-tRNA synthetase